MRWSRFAFAGILVGAAWVAPPPARPNQARRLRVAIHQTSADPIGAAFVASLREAVGASSGLALAPDPTRVDVDVTVVTTPVECDRQTQSAIAIAAHRLGRARSTQWVNVLFADEPHAREYAGRAAADLAAALAEPARHNRQ
jgi:hypothetical protein